MEELFTFNSQQFQVISRRPSSTDNPPNIRKRIITSKISKKSSAQSQASTREDAAIGYQNKLSPLRKVTFNIDHLLQNRPTNNQNFLSYPKKTISLAFTQSKQNINQHHFEKNIQAQLSNKQKQIQSCQLGMRCLSTREPVDKQMISKDEEIINKKIGSVRQRRVFSQKFSPKIVPISQRKLPKAFKINCLVGHLPKIQRKDQIREGLNTSNDQNKGQNEQISRLQRSGKLKLFRKQILFCQD